MVSIPSINYGALWPTPNVINVRGPGYQAVGNGSDDDTAAFISAINAANAISAAGHPAIVWAPAGFYRVTSSLPQFKWNASFVGDGHQHTIILLDTAYSGDLFSWSEAWNSGATMGLLQNRSGAMAANFGVVGSRSAAQRQNVLTFYDRNDHVVIANVSAHNIKGQVLGIGATQDATAAYMRESTIYGLRCESCGDTGVPTIDINSTGSGTEATNEIEFLHVNVFSPYGDGVVLRNGCPNIGIRMLKFTHLRVEGLQSSSLPGDLLVIGDATLSGAISTISFAGSLKLTSPYTNMASLKIHGPDQTATDKIYDIKVDHLSIGPGPGNGLDINGGRNIDINLMESSVDGTDIIVGARTGNLRLSGLYASTWAWNVDAAAADKIEHHFMVVGNPNVAISNAVNAANFSGTKFIKAKIGGETLYIPAMAGSW